MCHLGFCDVVKSDVLGEGDLEVLWLELPVEKLHRDHLSVGVA